MRPATVAALSFVVAGIGAPVSALDHTLVVGGGTIHVEVRGGSRDDALVLRWVEDSARAVAGYFGRFPVPAVNLVVRMQAGREVGGGTTNGGPSPTIRVSVGTGADRTVLREDWVLTHEMSHLALPDLSTGDSWAEEGLATYVEPIARAKVGTLSVDEVWSGLWEGLPKGMPGPRDRGLHGTKDWGRTYWGGALFWFLADVEIHELSHGRLGLRDALRGILDGGGDIRAHWPLAKALSQADRAVGLTVLTGLYARLGSAPGRVDLTQLWHRLGVRRLGNCMAYDDSAPMAAIRRDIAAPPAR